MAIDFKRAKLTKILMCSLIELLESSIEINDFLNKIVMSSK